MAFVSSEAEIDIDVEPDIEATPVGVASVDKDMDALPDALNTPVAVADAVIDIDAEPSAAATAAPVPVAVRAIDVEPMMLRPCDALAVAVSRAAASLRLAIPPGSCGSSHADGARWPLGTAAFCR